VTLKGRTATSICRANLDKAVLQNPTSSSEQTLHSSVVMPSFEDIPLASIPSQRQLLLTLVGFHLLASGQI
jgi:hypothetical protein